MNILYYAHWKDNEDYEYITDVEGNIILIKYYKGCSWIKLKKSLLKTSNVVNISKSRFVEFFNVISEEDLFLNII